MIDKNDISSYIKKKSEVEEHIEKRIFGKAVALHDCEGEFQLVGYSINNGEIKATIDDNKGLVTVMLNLAELSLKDEEWELYLEKCKVRDNFNQKMRIAEALRVISGMEPMIRKRAMEKIEVQKRGFGKRNSVDYVVYDETGADVIIIDDGYDLRDERTVTIQLIEILMTDKAWEEHLKSL